MPSTTPSPGFTGTASLSTTAGSITPPTTGAFSNGTRTESVTLTTAGSGRTIIATSGSAIGTSTGFTVNPGRATALTLTRQPTTIVANGTSTSVITATLRDANGNLTPSVTVFFTTTAGTFVSTGTTSRTATTDGNGVVTVTLKSSTVAPSHGYGQRSGSERQRRHHGHVCGGHGEQVQAYAQRR